MRAWFEGLERREQIFVAGGAVVVFIILLWAGVWMPVDKMHRDAANSVDRWQRALVDLRRVGARLAQSPGERSTGSISSSDSPVVIVDTTLRQLDLNSSVTRRQPTPNGIRVEFEAVPFDQLAVWLGEMSSNYAMEVQAGNMSIANVGGPGRINASLTLERTP